MTREERKKIIRAAIDEIDDWTPRNVAYAITTIADKWEEDSEETYQRGIWVGQESVG